MLLILFDTKEMKERLKSTLYGGIVDTVQKILSPRVVMMLCPGRVFVKRLNSRGSLQIHCLRLRVSEGVSDTALVWSGWWNVSDT